MRILVTGATGVVGTEVVSCLLTSDRPPHLSLTRVARRPDAGPVVCWDIGNGPPPAELGGHWDVIVHAAASTRWTLSREEAVTANIRPLRAVLDLADPSTHLVHISTAYVAGDRDLEDPRSALFDGYRNGYEWSKALGESIVRETHRGPLTLVRPPLVVGRRHSGEIARFSGPYTLLQALVSGLAAVVVGDPDGYAEISPVNDVAAAVTAAVLSTPPATPRTEVIAGGLASLRLATLLDITCRTINECRAEAGVAPIARPPIVSGDSWDRFFLPLAEQYLSPFQSQAVKLLAMFQSYTSMNTPFEPTWPVEAPGEVMAASVRHWAARKPRLALASPVPWKMIGTPR
ncbi:SDR family oxidoreductase [Streptomyces sp. NPDC012623]|uniref:SDR family oxidoreductase n=1 Tax=unclassified Streptomyces TaxID=2593676 RepID=UPI0036CD39F8